MHTALKEGQVRGTTASVCIVQELVHKTNVSYFDSLKGDTLKWTSVFHVFKL